MPLGGGVTLSSLTSTLHAATSSMSMPSHPLPSAADAIAEAMGGAELRHKIPRLEDAVEEMRRQHDIMMKMFIETNKNIHESINLAKIAIQSTNDLAQNMSKGHAMNYPVGQPPNPQVLPSHQVEAISTAWTNAAVSVVEGAASHAAKNAVNMMKQPKLPEIVLKGMEKVAQAFLKDMRKYSRSVKAFEDAEKKVAIMVEDQEHNRYPPGIRPFASSTTFVELDEKFSKALQEPHSINFTIPVGTSRRDAMRMIHHFFTSTIKSIELEALADHRDSLNTMATKEVLTAKCKSTVEEIVMKDADLRKLSIDSPNRLVVDEVQFKAKVEEHYTQVVKKVVDEMNKNEEKKAKEKEQEEKEKEEFAKQRPENLLKDLVNHMVNEQVQKHKVNMSNQADLAGEDEEMPPMDINENEGRFDEDEAMSKLVTAFKGKGPKNGKSPGAAPGKQDKQQHTMGTGKGKSKTSVPHTGKNNQQQGKAGSTQPLTHNAHGKNGKKGKNKKGHQGTGKKGGKKGKNYGGKK